MIVAVKSAVKRACIATALTVTVLSAWANAEDGQVKPASQTVNGANNSDQKNGRAPIVGHSVSKAAVSPLVEGLRLEVSLAGENLKSTDAQLDSVPSYATVQGQLICVKMKICNVDHAEAAVLDPFSSWRLDPPFLWPFSVEVLDEKGQIVGKSSMLQDALKPSKPSGGVISDRYHVLLTKGTATIVLFPVTLFYDMSKSGVYSIKVKYSVVDDNRNTKVELSAVPLRVSLAPLLISRNSNLIYNPVEDGNVVTAHPDLR